MRRRSFQRTPETLLWQSGFYFLTAIVFCVSIKVFGDSVFEWLKVFISILTVGLIVYGSMLVAYFGKIRYERGEDPKPEPTPYHKSYEAYVKMLMER